ncbi:MAG: HEAT repeat domain-containing protein [Deltaproteobacteria bacterium]|nr:HEAT repeat domain-containing protein [Deltaproteobacteria bacterium]
MDDREQDLSRRLSDESPEVRRRAVATLAEAPDDATVDLLVTALGDTDWRVRKEAVRVAAGLARFPGAVTRLVAAVEQDDNVGLRNAAAEALGAYGSRAVDAILGRLPAMGAASRKIAVEVVGASADPRAQALLVEHLRDPDANVRACAAEWLGERGGVEGTRALCEALSSRDSLLVIAALQSLNRQGARIEWETLATLAGRRIYGADLLTAMGRSGAPEAVPFVASALLEEPVAATALVMLHGASLGVAAAVERALAEMDDGRLDALAKWMLECEPALQQSAAACLLLARRERCIPTLVDAAQNEMLHPVILEGFRRWGEEAAFALEVLLSSRTGRDLASVIGILAQVVDEEAGRTRTALFAAYLGSADTQVATAAAGALARFGDVRVVPRLLELTGSRDLRARRAAGHALTEIGRRFPQEVRERVRKAEIDGERGVELCAVLEVVGRPEDAGVLGAALGSPVPELRRAVLGALAAVAGAAAVDTISFAMTDEDLGVRMAAAAALARIGPEASETIVSALRTSEGPLTSALTRALGEVGHPEAAGILRQMARGSSDVALAALEAMRSLNLDAGPVGEGILSSPDPEGVKQALAVLGAAVGVERLALLLESPDWDVRLAAVDVLAARAGSSEARRLLERRLGAEDDDMVRIAIERALGAGGEPE